MDAIDLTIIERLTHDARTSFRKIARELKISTDTVINRYKKLQENGLIRGSTVVINPEKIGYQGMAVFLIDVSPSHILADEATSESSKILEKLIQMRNIIVATRAIGDHDLFALSVIKNFRHLMELGNDIAKIPGVKDLQFSFWVGGAEVCPKYFII